MVLLPSQSATRRTVSSSGRSLPRRRSSRTVRINSSGDITVLCQRITTLSWMSRDQVSQARAEDEAHPAVEAAEIGGLNQEQHRQRDRPLALGAAVETLDVEGHCRIARGHVDVEDVEGQEHRELVYDQR